MKLKIVKLMLWVIALHCTTENYAQTLGRRASFEASISYPVQGKPGARINSIEEGSPLEKAGIEPGTIILKVDDRLADSPEAWTSITYGLKADRSVKLLLRFGNKVFESEITLNALGYESHDKLDTYYEEVISDYGITQRTIITKPKNAKGKQPAIFLVQGLSCSTIEKYSGRGGNWVNQINYIVEESGMVVMRVDKPGVGDSEGDCACTDFETELAGYRAALRDLKTKSYVDTTRIVVYGASMGSALAPLIANEYNLAGVISDGTFFKTWFEHMLEIERRILHMKGNNESEIVKLMNEVYIPMYYEMLINKKSYAEAIDEYPALADHNYHSPMHMYGRPVSYYHQLQEFNLAGEWEKLEVPVRIMYGSNDWIMSEFDNHMIIEVLDNVGHEDHQLMIYPGLDHWNTIHEKPEDSFNFKQGSWDPNVPKTIVTWANEMVH